VEEACPEEVFSEISTGISRPSFPSVPTSPIPEDARPAEQIWRHTDRVLVNGSEFQVRGLAQVLKVLLQACEAALYPEELRT
jgi:hypothetical protein